jgi:hypothetical protein
VTVQLYTASWSALFAADKAGQLDVQPVRISRSVPRFWPAAERFPSMPELMPLPWMLGLDGAVFFGSYRRRLCGIGLPAIAAALDAIPAEKLALACFEKSEADCHRGPEGFSGWWQERTGDRIEEWAPEPAQQQFDLDPNERREP